MMSKKNAIILILTVFIASLGALLWLYFSANTPRPVAIQTEPGVDVYDPFGTKAADQISNQNSDQTTEIPSTDQGDFITANKLRQISIDPVAGFTLFNKNNRDFAHYILRSNGNIYQAYADSQELKRLSITTVPKVYESTWMPDGNHLILRYLRDTTENIQTFSVKINPATTTLNEFEGGIDGNFLPENISALSINPLGDKIFYLTNNLQGASGFISKPDGLNKKIIFESPLIEWNVSWPKEDTITMTTKPSSKLDGYLYFLNSQNGSFSKILGGVKGLTTKTNSLANEVLYSDSERGEPRLYLFDVKAKQSKILPWSTLPEKCVWSTVDTKIIYCAVPTELPAGEYPDSWYQGLTTFNDEIWSVNVTTGASTLVFAIEKEAGYKLDIIDPQISQSDNYLFFTDKTSLTLWSLKLK